jgi:hypothetical protein
VAELQTTAVVVWVHHQLQKITPPQLQRIIRRHLAVDTGKRTRRCLLVATIQGNFWEFLLSNNFLKKFLHSI